jgi:UDP-N-acetylmuramoyl-L-alanyl-D-glutamate--2,6-diaminopimelate ligase
LAHDVLSASDVKQDAAGIGFDAHFGGLTVTVHAPVFGDFNVENLLGTLAVLLGLGHSLTMAARRLEQVRPVPGRMERFYATGGPAVIVDYAHTPDALEKTLSSLRSHCEGKLWVVFGCGGDRDKGKRPLMGSIADSLADGIVVTDDNPRSEDGDAIVADILAGCAATKATVIRDRRRAVTHAIDMALEGDMVLVAGKGHETTQEIKGIKYPFSDRDLVRELLARRQAAG